MRSAALVLGLCLCVPFGLAAQDATDFPNPGSACFEVDLGSSAGDRTDVEFILAPSASPGGTMRQPWDLRGPVRAESAALWWPLGADSISAVWLREAGVLWELRLDPRPVVMTGTAAQVMPRPETPASFEVVARPIECAGGVDDAHAAGEG